MGGDNYTAACACWTYKDNISNTQWYLPAMGELGYMMARWNEIDNGLKRINAVKLNRYANYWSSSEYSSDAAYNLNPASGYISFWGKGVGRYVRPWAIVG